MLRIPPTQLADRPRELFRLPQPEILLSLRKSGHLRVMAETQAVPSTGQRNLPGDPRIVAQRLLIERCLVDRITVAAALWKAKSARDAMALAWSRVLCRAAGSSGAHHLTKTRHRALSNLASRGLWLERFRLACPGRRACAASASRGARRRTAPAYGVRRWGRSPMHRTADRGDPADRKHAGDRMRDRLCQRQAKTSLAVDILNCSPDCECRCSRRLLMDPDDRQKLVSRGAAFALLAAARSALSRKAA